ncbi:hypothetical protein ACFQH6_19540 [Halobacteriaceae archaeon GCM10025711]
MSDTGSEFESNRVMEQYGIVAEDSFRLLRLNIVLIGIYVSGIAILLRTAEPTVQSRLLESPYTIFGLFSWLLSTFSAYFTYEPSRKASLAHLYDDPTTILERFNSGVQSFKLRLSVGLTLISGALLGIGVWDAYIPTQFSLDVVWAGFSIILMTLVGILIITRVSVRAYDFVSSILGRLRYW